jgi:hypothetical protein
MASLHPRSFRLTISSPNSNQKTAKTLCLKQTKLITILHPKMKIKTKMLEEKRQWEIIQTTSGFLGGHLPILPMLGLVELLSQCIYLQDRILQEPLTQLGITIEMLQHNSLRSIMDYNQINAITSHNKMQA